MPVESLGARPPNGGEFLIHAQERPRARRDQDSCGSGSGREIGS